MVLINNKKGTTTAIFGFFFILMIFSSLFFFLSFGVHYILYDYAIKEAEYVATTILPVNATAITNIQTLSNGYLGLTGFYDILFLVLLVSAFIETTIASLKAKEDGYLSFFGFVTIGNVLLIFILSYATKIQGWILNDLVYNVILVSVQTPVITFFFNYSMFIAVFWYLWLLGINQINLEGIKERVPNIFSRDKLTNDEGRFEE